MSAPVDPKNQDPKTKTKEKEKENEKEKVNKPPIYLSFDTENDGPSPISSNCFAFGLAILDAQGKSWVVKDVATAAVRCTPDKAYCGYEWNILTDVGKLVEGTSAMAFWKQPENRATFTALHQNPVSVESFAQDVISLYTELQKDFKVVWVAWPAAYDWQWLNCLVDMGKPPGMQLPIGFHARCASSMYDIYKEIFGADAMPKDYGGIPHDHTPFHDALGQGLKYLKMIQDFSNKKLASDKKSASN